MNVKVFSMKYSLVMSKNLKISIYDQVIELFLKIFVSINVKLSVNSQLHIFKQ